MIYLKGPINYVFTTACYAVTPFHVRNNAFRRKPVIMLTVNVFFTSDLEAENYFVLLQTQYFFIKQIKLYKTLIRPVLEYSSEIWVLSKSEEAVLGGFKGEF